MKKLNFKGVKRSLKNFGKAVNNKSPQILTATSIAGGITTCVIVAKKAPIVKEQLDILHEELAERDEDLTKAQIMWEEAKVAVPIYAPAIVTGSASIAAALGSCKISTKRTAVYATALELAQNNLIDYKKKAKEFLGDTKAEKLDAAVAQEKVNKNPPPKELVDPENNEVILTDGLTLVYDSTSGRYFRSSVDLINRAVARLNKNLISEMYVSLNDLYSELGIPPTKIGDDMGWNIDEIIEVNYNSILAPGDVPALVLDFLVKPRFRYDKLL